MYSKETTLRLVLALCSNLAHSTWLAGSRLSDTVGKAKKNVCEKRVGALNPTLEHRFLRFPNLYLGAWNRLPLGCPSNHETFLWMACPRNGFCNNFTDGF